MTLAVSSGHLADAYLDLGAALVLLAVAARLATLRMISRRSLPGAASEGTPVDGGGVRAGGG